MEQVLSLQFTQHSLSLKRRQNTLHRWVFCRPNAINGASAVGNDSGDSVFGFRAKFMHGVYKQRYIVGVWTEKSAFSLERQAGGRPLRQTKLSAEYLRSVSTADKRSGSKFACFHVDRLTWEKCEQQYSHIQNSAASSRHSSAGCSLRLWGSKQGF